MRKKSRFLKSKQAKPLTGVEWSAERVRGVDEMNRRFIIRVRPRIERKNKALQRSSNTMSRMLLG